MTVLFKGLILVAAFRIIARSGKKQALQWGFSTAALFSVLNCFTGTILSVYYAAEIVLLFLAAPAVMYAYWKFDSIPGSTLAAACGSVILVFIVPLLAVIFSGWVAPAA